MVVGETGGLPPPHGFIMDFPGPSRLEGPMGPHKTVVFSLGGNSTAELGPALAAAGSQLGEDYPITPVNLPDTQASSTIH